MNSGSSTPFIMEGPLKKQGGRLKTWKLRWFKLTPEGIMRYYSMSDRNRMIAEFNLVGNELVIIPNDALDMQQNEKFMFEIKSGNGSRITDSHESFLLWATSEEERESWLFQIKKILYRSRGGAIFGHPLSETMEVDGRNNYFVPRIVKELVDFIYQEGTEVEGIFRLSGRKKLVTQLIEDYDRGLKIDLKEEGVDSNIAASVLKQYLRRLPQPLIPFDRFEAMSTYGSKLTLAYPEVYELVRNGISSLPTWNYNLLKYLICLLVHIASKADVNKMSAENLAAVHAPNILRLEHENPELSASVNTMIVDTTLGLIRNFDVIFTKDYVIPQFPQETETAPLKPMISRDSKEAGDCGGSADSLAFERDQPQESQDDAKTSISSDMESEKVTPGADYYLEMVKNLKQMLASEQVEKKELADKLASSEEENSRLLSQIRQLEKDKEKLQKQLKKITGGSLA